jgi:cytochrome c oxidase assembly protein subunit 15
MYSLWFRRLAILGAALAYTAVVVGAYVRLTDAGLGCPDWPGCYGHLRPAAAAVDVSGQAKYARPFEYGRALREMQHRYLASTLGTTIVALVLIAVLNRRDPDQPKRLPAALLVLVALQGALGRLTVTGLVNPSIVTLHLAGGLATLGVLVWLALPRPRLPQAPGLRPWAVAAGVLLVAQILLGGWTSSNYAGPACPDFPTCQGRIWPDADFPQGFNLWPGLGPDYQGGRLPGPARVAIQISHRAGAVAAGAALLLLAAGAIRRRRGPIRALGLALAAAVVLQWLIGMNLIWQGFPLALGTAHNATAALLLVLTLALWRQMWPGESAPR